MQATREARPGAHPVPFFSPAILSPASSANLLAGAGEEPSCRACRELGRGLQQELQR